MKKIKKTYNKNHIIKVYEDCLYESITYNKKFKDAVFEYFSLGLIGDKELGFFDTRKDYEYYIRLMVDVLEYYDHIMEQYKFNQKMELKLVK